MISATYASTTSFTVSGDRRTDFNPGRAVYCDCGVDGIKYGYVDYSTYSSPSTTVNLISTESQAITSNLASVLFSRVKFEDGGTGNLPIEILWNYRGRQTVPVTYKDADEITLGQGVIHIDDGTAEAVYRCNGFDKQLTSLSVSTWYAIYAQPPTNGRILSASDISYSSTMPTLNTTKQGFYHPSNANQRCIGFVFSNASSNLTPFSHSRGLWQTTDSYIAADVFLAAPSTTWTTYTLTLPIGDLTALCMVLARYVDYSQNYLQTRQVGSSSTGGMILARGGTSSFTDGITFPYLPVDANKQFQLKFTGAGTDQIIVHTRGFLLPSSVYNG